MSVNTFIPTLWAARILKNLNDVHVYADANSINRDYQGQIKGMGDKVKINSIGRVTIGTYTPGSNINAPEDLQTADQDLEISQAKYFNFAVDDVDRAQVVSGGALMDAAMQEAGWGLADVVDTYLAGLYTEIASANELGSQGSPVSITSSNAYTKLVELSVILDENNVPKQGRWVVVPPWYKGLLLQDARFVGYGTAANDERLRNGVVGRIAGFDVKESNNVPLSTTVYKVIAGHRIGWSFAEQIVQVEAFRPELRFADAVKGLHVYGAKMTRPNAFGLLHAAE